MAEPMDDADLASLEAIRDATDSEATRLLLTAIIDIHTGADAATVLAVVSEAIAAIKAENSNG